MTGGSGDLKLKLLRAVRELVASDPISVRLRRVARGIHTLVEHDFPSDLPQVWQRFHALKDELAGKYALSREDQASIPRTRLKEWRNNFSIYLPSCAIRERFGLLVGKIGV
jgi:hypothetical protein